MPDWTTFASRAVRAIALADAKQQTDRELLERFTAEANQFAFAALVERHGPMVFGVCRRLLTRRQDAEDATQAVFVLLARKAKETSWRPSIANWLFATARKVARTARRAEARRMKREERSLHSEIPSTLDTVTGRELLAILDEELDQLSPRYREPLVLCYLEGVSRDEAARRLAVPLATLKSQLERGREKLAKALTARGCGLGSLFLLAAAEVEASSIRLTDSILASVSGTPPEAVVTLLQGVLMTGILTKTKLLALLGIGTALVGLGLASVHTAPLQKGDAPNRVEKKIDERKVEAEPSRTADGFALPVGAIRRFGNRQMRHADGFNATAVSPDGKLLATRGERTIVVWDLATLNAKRVFGEPGTYYHAGDLGCAFTPDSKSIFVSNGPSPVYESVTKWDLETGEKKFDIQGSHLGAWLISGGKEIALVHVLSIQYYDATNGRRTRPETKFPTPFQQTVSPSPRGDLIVGFDRQGGFRVVDARGGEEKFSSPNDKSVFAPAISPDSKLLVYADRNERRVHAVDLESGKELSSFANPAGDQPGPMRISPDNRTLYLASTTGKLYRWDLKENRALSDLGAHSGWTLTHLALSPDGKFLYSTGHNRLIRRWDLTAGKELPLPEGYISLATVLPDRDGKRLLVGDHEKSLDYWDLETGRLLKRLEWPGNNWLAQSRDGRWLASGATDQVVRILDTSKGNGKPVIVPLIQSGEKKNHFDHVRRVEFSPDAKLLYCNTNEAGIFALETSSGKRVWKDADAGPHFALDATGSFVVTSIKGNVENHVHLHVLDAKTGERLRGIEVIPLPRPKELGRPFPSPTSAPGVMALAPLPRGLLVVSLHADGTMRVFDAAHGQERMRAELPNRLSSPCVAISPDGRWLAMPQHQRRIVVLEVASGKEVFSMGDHDSGITQLAFTQDGQRLISSADISPILWDLRPSAPRGVVSPDEVWSLLDSDDAKLVYCLQWHLIDNGKMAQEIFQERINPEDWKFDRQRFDRLVKDLDSPRFAAREASQKELSESQKIPLDWLHGAIQHAESEEAKERLRRVLEVRDTPEEWRKLWRVGRCLQVVERIGDEPSRALLRKWATVGGDSFLGGEAKAALDRLEKR